MSDPMTSLAPITHPLLTAAGFDHGFFTRAGGVSTGIYKGLNTGVGSKDDPAAVAENRRRVAAHFGADADHLNGCYQIHSAVARVADAPWSDDRPEGDAVGADAEQRRGVASGLGDRELVAGEVGLSGIRGVEVGAQRIARRPGRQPGGARSEVAATARELRARVGDRRRGGERRRCHVSSVTGRHPFV